ncbi:dnaJ homolog subfamily C member 30, mitochondrial-like [Portunus trituberculatus]|uniref:dnaJ homolog subfamily C member 30, mitochondrial-like n=1 Tax=Portunus trituberculatus TaxID=210409 RepID=UPI001E1CBE25|nr:dnaJ homolog subfamily C member 30, mitochondrial-like [Portunus trituberculatus]
MNLVIRGRARSSSKMWLRRYSVYEILSVRDERRCRLLFRAALAAVHQQQVVHASRVRSTLENRQRNYYDVLKITPKATQAQIKNAYYKLSKKYHPDQYKGDEDPAKKFREIKEAYEILGNFSQRKMYDRGLLGMSTAATPGEAEEYSSKFYESRRKRGAVPTTSGRTPIYNFDEWTKVHYQSSWERKQDAKIRYEDVLRQRSTEVEEKKTQSAISVLMLLIIAFLIHICMSSSYDSEKPKSKQK